MAVYRRGKTWWYVFEFGGRRVQESASILMTMRYVHPAADQKQVAIEKLEKFRAEGIINDAAIRQSHRVPTKVTTVEHVN